MKHKERIGRKILSWLLTLAMIISMMPQMSISTLAADVNGTGENYYLVQFADGMTKNMTEDELRAEAAIHAADGSETVTINGTEMTWSNFNSLLAVQDLAALVESGEIGPYALDDASRLALSNDLISAVSRSVKPESTSKGQEIKIYLTKQSSNHYKVNTGKTGSSVCSTYSLNGSTVYYVDDSAISSDSNGSYVTLEADSSGFTTYSDWSSVTPTVTATNMSTSWEITIKVARSTATNKAAKVNYTVYNTANSNKNTGSVTIAANAKEASVKVTVSLGSSKQQEAAFVRFEAAENCTLTKTCATVLFGNSYNPVKSATIKNYTYVKPSLTPADWNKRNPKNKLPNAITNAAGLCGIPYQMGSISLYGLPDGMATVVLVEQFLGNQGVSASNVEQFRIKSVSYDNRNFVKKITGVEKSIRLFETSLTNVTDDDNKFFDGSKPKGWLATFSNQENAHFTSSWYQGSKLTANGNYNVYITAVLAPTTKVKGKDGGYIYDDSTKNRRGWNGNTYNGYPSTDNNWNPLPDNYPLHYIAIDYMLKPSYTVAVPGNSSSIYLPGDTVPILVRSTSKICDSGKTVTATLSYKSGSTTKTATITAASQYNKEGVNALLFNWTAPGDWTGGTLTVSNLKVAGTTVKSGNLGNYNANINYTNKTSAFNTSGFCTEKINNQISVKLPVKSDKNWWSWMAQSGEMANSSVSGVKKLSSMKALVDGADKELLVHLNGENIDYLYVPLEDGILHAVSFQYKPSGSSTWRDAYLDNTAFYIPALTNPLLEYDVTGMATNGYYTLKTVDDITISYNATWKYFTTEDVTKVVAPKLEQYLDADGSRKPMTLSYTAKTQNSTGSKFGYSDARFFHWTSSDETIATIGGTDGVVTLTGKTGEVTFYLICDNGKHPVRVASTVLTVSESPDPYLFIPGTSRTVVTREGMAATVRFTANIAQRNAVLANNDNTETEYTLTVKNGAGDTVYTTTKTGSMNAPVSYITIPENTLTMVGEYIATVTASYKGDVAGLGNATGYEGENGNYRFSASANITVKAALASITLTNPTNEKGEESSYVLDTDATVRWTIKGTADVISRVEIRDSQGNSYEPTTATSFTFPKTTGKLKEIYTVTVYATNDEDYDGWSVASSTIYVYNAAALDILVQESKSVSLSNGVAAILDNRAWLQSLLSADGKTIALGGANISFAELQHDATLQAVVSLNFGDYAWGNISDQISWSAKDPVNAGIFYYHQASQYVNLLDLDLTSVFPDGEFTEQGLGDGTVQITATHAGTGQSTGVTVTIDRVEEVLYLFQFNPRTVTTVTYRDKNGSQHSVKSDAQGQLALLELSGISKDYPIYLSSAADVSFYDENGDLQVNHNVPFVGMIEPGTLLTGEVDSIQHELYPVNTHSLLSPAQATVYLQTPDGKPLARGTEIIYRGGAYYDGKYATKADLFTVYGESNIGDENISNGLVDNTVKVNADGGFQLFFNLQQVADGTYDQTKDLQYVFELRVPGYKPALVRMDPRACSSAVCALRTEEVNSYTNETEPFTNLITLRRWGKDGSEYDEELEEPGDVSFVGPNAQYPRAELEIETILWNYGGLIEETTADGVKTGCTVGENQLTQYFYEPDNGGSLKVLGDTVSRGYQTSTVWAYPFSSIPILTTRLALNGDSFNGWLAENHSTPTQVLIRDGKFSVKQPGFRYWILNGLSMIDAMTSERNLAQIMRSVEGLQNDMSNFRLTSNDFVNGVFELVSVAMKKDKLYQVHPLFAATSDPTVYYVFLTMSESDYEIPSSINMSTSSTTDRDLAGSGNFGTQYVDFGNQLFNELRPTYPDGTPVTLDSFKQHSNSSGFEMQGGGSLLAKAVYDPDQNVWNLHYISGAIDCFTHIGFSKSFTPVPGVTIRVGANTGADKLYMADNHAEAANIQRYDLIRQMSVGGGVEAFAGGGFSCIVTVEVGVYGQVQFTSSNASMTSSLAHYDAGGDYAGDTIVTMQGKEKNTNGRIALRIKVGCPLGSKTYDLASTNFNSSEYSGNYEKMRKVFAGKATLTGTAALASPVGLKTAPYNAEWSDEEGLLLSFETETVSTRTLLSAIADGQSILTKLSEEDQLKNIVVTEDGTIFYLDDLTASWASADGVSKGAITVVDREHQNREAERGDYGHLYLDAAGSGNNLFAAWSTQTQEVLTESRNTTSVLGDIAEIDFGTILNSTELMVAHYTGSSWVTKKLTANDVVDIAPQVAANGEKAIVVWIQGASSGAAKTGNSLLDAFNLDLNSKLMVSRFDGSQWSEPIAVVNTATLGNVGSLDVKLLSDGTALFAYSVQPSKNGGTDVKDQEIYYTLYSGSGEVRTIRATQNAVVDGDVRVRVVDGNEFIVSWYTEKENASTVTGDIRLLGVKKNGSLDETIPESINVDGVEIGGSYDIAGDSVNGLTVAWLQNEELADGQKSPSSALYGMKLYRDDTKTVVSPAQKLGVVTGKNITADRFQMSLNGMGLAALLEERDFSGDKNVTYTLPESDFPGLSKADRTITVPVAEYRLEKKDNAAFTDSLAITDILFNEALAAPNTTLPVWVAVRNMGVHKITGLVLGGQNHDVTLYPGDSTVLQVNVAFGSRITDYSSTLTATGDGKYNAVPVEILFNAPRVTIDSSVATGNFDSQTVTVALTNDNSLLPMSGSGRSLNVSLYARLTDTAPLVSRTVSAEDFRLIDNTSLNVDLQTSADAINAALGRSGDLPKEGIPLYVVATVSGGGRVLTSTVSMANVKGGIGAELVSWKQDEQQLKMNVGYTNTTGSAIPGFTRLAAYTATGSLIFERFIDNSTLSVSSAAPSQEFTVELPENVTAALVIADLTDAVAVPQSPSNAGYVFDKWYLDNAYENVAESFTAATTYYAHWLPAYSVTLTANSEEILYDGTEHTVEGWTVDDDKEGHFTGQAESNYGMVYTVSGVTAVCSTATNAGSYEVVFTGTPVITNGNNEDVTDQFEVSYEEGLMTINKRSVTLISASLSKAYDGVALTNGDEEITVEGDGWAENEGATYSDFTGTVTLPGSTQNVFTYTLDENTIADNYDITVVEGTLTIKDRNEPDDENPDDPDRKYEITVAANSGKFKYDGSNKSVSGFETLEFSENGVKYTVSGLSAEIAGTDVGIYDVVVTGTAVVKDAEGNDVTGQFIVNTENGTLTIEKRSVILTSATESKAYDGLALTNDEVIVSGDGWADGEGAAYSVTGTQMLPGDSANSFTYVLNNNTKAKNYDITTQFGTLTVQNRAEKLEITVTAKSADYTYDGVEKTVSGFETLEFTVGGVKFTVSGLSAEASGTDAGTYDVIVSGTAVVKDTEGNDVTGQFSVTTENGTLTIEKRSVTLTSATDSKVYDGTALTNGEVSVSGDGWANGEGASYSVTGTRTLPGDSANNFTYVLNENTKANNYEITTQFGTLTIQNRTEKLEITVTANSGEYTYDGTEKTVNGFENLEFTIGGVKFTVSGLSAEVSEADAGTYGVVVTGTAVVKDADGNDVTGQFSVNKENGTLTIGKRSVILTSATDSKTYDGTALTNNEVTVSGDGWANGEGASYSVTGTQLLPGDSANNFTYVLNENTKANNYEITTQFGTLTVQNRTEKLEITVTAKSGEYTYDGTEKNISGFETLEFAVGGVKFTISGLTAEVSGTDAGTYGVVVSGTAIVKDAGGNDVTGQFNVNTENGTLTIGKRSVTLTSATDSKVYDGTALTNGEVTVGGDGWAEGEGASYSITGTRTLPGDTVNYFTYVLNENTKANNYEITTVSGMLTIRDRLQKPEITITAKSGQYTYDGAEKTISGFETLEFNENGVKYTVSGLSASVSGTDAGTYDVVVTGTAVVVDAEGNDVSRQFSVKTENGTLTIGKRSVVLTSATDSKEYNGKALQNDEVTVSGSGWAEGEGASYYVTGTQTLPGDSANSFTYVLNNNTKANNYEIITQFGTLTVQNRTEKFEITVTANSGEYTYDGTEKKVSGFGALEFTVDGVKFTVSGLSAEIAGTDAGTYDIVVTGTAVVKDEDGNDVTGQFTVGTENGTMTIEKRSVILTSATDSKAYDGTELTNDEVTVGGDGWAEGEGATYSVTGTQKLVGSSTNSFTYNLNEGTKAENYSITKNEGTLSITNRDTKYEIDMKVNSNTVTYDGTEKSVSGFETLEYTVDGVDYTVSGLDAGVSGTDAGTYDVAVTGTAVVKDAEGNDVTEQFIVRANGILTINARSVILTSATDSKTYDGTALTNDEVTAGGDGWAEGEGASYFVTGTQTVPGSTDNCFTYVLNENTKAGNYEITANFGTLTIQNRTEKPEITVTANSGEYTYDGTEKTVSGFETLEYTVGGVKYIVSGLDAGVSGTDAGTYHVAVTGTAVVKDMEGNDVTGQFIVKTENGTMVIGKRSVNLTSATDSKTYDGTALTNDEVTVSGDGWAEGEGASYDVTGARTLPGDTINNFTYVLNENTRAGNYEITTNFGTLTVLERTEKFEITVTANSGEYTYDDAEKTVSGFVTLEYNLGGVKYTVSGLSAEASGTDAGTYDVAVTGTAVVKDEEGNDVTGQFIVRTENGTLTILKVGQEKPTGVTATDNGLQYDGTAQALVIVDASTLAGGTIQYALGVDDITAPADGWSTSIPTGTNAGTYYVWYKAVGDGNHGDSEAAVITVIIAKKSDLVATINDEGLWCTYDAISLAGEIGQEYIIVEKGIEISEESWTNVILPDAEYGTVYFDQLNQLTDYVIYTRVAATENSEASTPVSLEIRTKEELFAYQELACTPGCVTDITGSPAATAESNPFGTKIVNGDELEGLLEVSAEDKTAGVNVWLDIKDGSATVSVADKDAIDEAKGDLEVGLYLDLSLNKKVGDGAPAKVTQTNGKMVVSIVIPESQREAGRTFKVISASNGAATEPGGVYNQATGTLTFETDVFSTCAIVFTDSAEASSVSRVVYINVYRLYNAVSREHLLTTNEVEKEALLAGGWSDEGIAWVAPDKAEIAVYRLYNPTKDRHFYTADSNERNQLLANGWNDEGICWYTNREDAKPVYRLIESTGEHLYTADKVERAHLIEVGWKEEEICCFGGRQ